VLRRFLIACSFVVGVTAAADAKTLFRISTENTPQHHQTVLVERFAQAIRDRAGDKLEVRFSHSAALFRDRDVVDAMLRGQLEMAVPGSWQLERLVPNLGVFLLPMFYGRPVDATRAVMASDIGRSMVGELSLATGAHVLGAWLDLGYTHVYAKVPLTSPASLRGLRIRVAGGEANLARLRALGAEAIIIPWPDFPQALADGGVDGVLSSHATIASASLWRQGLLFAYEDREYFGQYVPLVGARVWQALPADLRATLATAWADVAAEAPEMAVRSQEEARKVLQDAGVRIVVPRARDTAEARAVLMGGQPALVARLGIDPALVKRIEDALQRWP
jgi:TRAP-type C4-dicarboxylate transport system substrate-binding protein